MKKYILTFLAILGACFASGGKETTALTAWKTDYQSALKQAKSEKKPLLLLFTGSDWCKVCIIMRSELFPNPRFQKILKSRVVPVYLDYPGKIKQSKQLIQQNQKLLAKYNVEGYPTVIIIDSNEKVKGTILGFSPVAEYLKNLEKILSAK